MYLLTPAAEIAVVPNNTPVHADAAKVAQLQNDLGSTGLRNLPGKVRTL